MKKFSFSSYLRLWNIFNQNQFFFYVLFLCALNTKNVMAQTCVTITQPDVLALTCSKTNVTVPNGSDGTVSVAVTGGTTPYSYLWSDGSTTATISNLAAGTYDVTVTDANSCDQICSSTVSAPGCSLNLMLVIAATPCQGTLLSADISGATGTVTYLWSNGETTASIQPQSVGDYTLVVTDAASCQDSKTYTVTVPPAPTLTCVGNSAGEGKVIVTGGLSPYTYRWSNNATTATINVSADGDYTVTVTDASACTATCTTHISVPGCTLSAMTLSSAFTCHGGTTGSVEVFVTGPGTITYLWSNNATTASVGGLSAGIYTVTATSGLCSVTATAQVSEPPAIALTCSKIDVTTIGGSNGSASVAVTGGVGPYTYLWSNTANTATLTGLTAGTYSVTVTDSFSCPSQMCSVVVHQPPCPTKICSPIIVIRL